ncbi:MULTISPECIES: DUF6049 family protein [unclassified Microbacterium]|uniref:DUF6049 family protein n=1 Tax=unclassified Microbacterium TaxID=2609290 RepID=UPI00386E92CC
MVRSGIAQEIDLAMTLFSSASGRRAPRRARWVRPAAAVAAALVLLSPLPASAATTDDAAGAEVEFTLAPTGQGVVSPGRPVVLSLTAVNSGDDSLVAGEMVVEQGATRLRDDTALTAWLDQGTADGAFRDVGSVDVDELAGQSETGLTLAVDQEDAGIDDLDPGVYPLRGTYTGADETFTARSLLIVPDTAAPDAGVGVIVPITAGPITTGLLGADALTELTGADGALTAQLDAVAATPAILAVDPAIVASIRVLGSSAPAEATAWLDRLMGLPNKRFALQFGDADLSAQVAAGLEAPLTMTSFAPYLDPVNFEPEAADAATPEATPTPAPVDLPTVAEILDIGASRDGVFWPATGTAGAEVATALGAAPSPTDVPLTLLPDDVTGDADAGPRASAESADLLLYDAALSDALAEASATDTPVARASRLTTLTARIELASSDAPLLLTVDRSTTRSGAALRDAILAVADLPGRSAVTLDALAESSPERVVLPSLPADENRADAVRAFTSAEPRLRRVASVLADPDLLMSNERATVLQLMGNGWRGDDDGWTAAVTAHRERIATWSEGVSLIPGSDITLAGSSAALVFTVRNDLPWPATVDLLATPNDARLVIQDAPTFIVGGEQSSRVEVPVEAVVGSGNSSIDLQLRSPTGIDLGARQTVAVSVHAEWESVAVITLSVLVSALLVFGIVRTVRRRRRMPVDA